MENFVYHGSPVQGLTVIRSNASTHLKKCVYASDQKAVALLFLGKGNGDLDTVTMIDEEGRLTLVERRPLVFEKLYQRKGSLYVLSKERFHHYDDLWAGELISFSEEPVLQEEKIDCVFETIRQLAEEGELNLYEYPTRPPSIPLDNSDLIERYLNFEKKGIQGAIRHLLKIYPQFEQSVISRLEEDSKVLNKR